MRNLLVLSVITVVSCAGFAASLQSTLGISDLEHRWTFNGTMDEDPAAIGANKGPAVFVGPDLSKGVLYATHAKLTNNPAGDTWGQVQNCSIALPSYIIRDSAFSAKTIELWVRDINAEGWENGLFYLGDGKDGEWGGHPMLRATSRINSQTMVSWFQSQQNPGGGYSQRGFNPNVGDDRAHQLVIVIAADNTWLEIYYDGVYKTGWAGVPWEGPGLDFAHNFNDSRNRIGATDDRTMDARWLTGEIYDFRIWGRELTAAEIATSYSLGSELPTLPQPITSVWPANGGAVRVGWLDSLQWDSNYSSYDVYMTTDYNAVLNADRSQYCNPASIPADIDDDCRVAMYDFEFLVEQWLGLPTLDQSADINSSGYVELGDLSKIAVDWQKTLPYRGNTLSESYTVGPFNDGKTYYWRIDGVENDQPQVQSPVWSFTGLNKWQPDEYVIGLGWPDIWEIVPADDYLSAISNMHVNVVMTQDFDVANHNWANYGIRVVLQDSNTGKVSQFKDNPNVWGYYVIDEPERDGSEFPQVAQMHLDFHKIDPYKPSLTTLNSVDPFPINLFGNQWSDYYNYISQFMNQVKFDILCYDHYPYRYDSSPWEEHWGCLEEMRTRSLQRGAALYRWEDAIQGNSYNASNNLNRMRWCIYTSMAYGVKGTYWYSASRIFEYNPNPCNAGPCTFTLRPQYYDVQTVCGELAKLGPELIKLTSVSVYHTPTVPPRTNALPPDHWVQVTNNCVLGMFKDKYGINYAVVSNRSDSSNNTVTVTFKTTVSSVQECSEQTGLWSLPLTISGSPGSQTVQFTLGPGYGKLLKIQ